MNKKLLIILAVFALSACQTPNSSTSTSSLSTTINYFENYQNDEYRNYYQILPYTFYDSNGDGIGDIQGIIHQLDYLRSVDPMDPNTLGVDGIYLLPIFQSPTYHKYDVEDYYKIDQYYGTLDDLKELISATHERDMKLILDMPFNHTSSNHAMFRQVREAFRDPICVNNHLDNKPTAECISAYPGVEFYNFIYGGASGYEILRNNWYYEARFDKSMPDLNLSSETVLNYIKDILQYYLELGVDGFRLDAVTSFFTGSQIKSAEIINFIDAACKEVNPNAYVVAEGPWSNEIYQYYDRTTIPSYMNFVFGNNRHIANAVKRGDAVTYGRQIISHEQSIDQDSTSNLDANFLTNHDTVRSINNFYTSSQKEVSIQKAKMALGLNLFLKGNSFIYYGEEIGMRSGSQADDATKDPNKRYPMNWSETDTTGRTGVAPGAILVDQYLPALDVQIEDPNSVFNFVKKALQLKAYYPEIARGTSEVIYSNEASLILKKRYQEQVIYLCYNLASESAIINISEEMQFSEICDYILTDDQNPVLSVETLSLPGYSITVLK